MNTLYYFETPYGKSHNTQFASSRDLEGYPFILVLMSGINEDGLVEIVFLSANGKQCNLLGFGREFNEIKNTFSEDETAIIKEYINRNFGDIFITAMDVDFGTETGLASSYKASAVKLGERELMDDTFTIYGGFNSHSKTQRFLQISFVSESAYFRVDLKRTKMHNEFGVENAKFSGFLYEAYEKVVRDYLHVHQNQIIQLLSRAAEQTLGSSGVQTPYSASTQQQSYQPVTEPEVKQQLPEQDKPTMSVTQQSRVNQMIQPPVTNTTQVKNPTGVNDSAGSASQPTAPKAIAPDQIGLN